MQFTPLEDFFCPVLKSGYQVGLTYTLRDPEEPGINERTMAGRGRLLEQLPKWLEEKKVRMGSAAPAADQEAAAAPAGVVGQGDVTE